jgi:hypothetical protein
MSPRSKREYIEAIFLRYKKASRREKTTILDEFCTVCGYYRKHAIRLLRGFKRFTKPKGRKRGRSPPYSSNDVLNPLKKIWLAGYRQHFGNLSPQATNALVTISPAIIDRVLRPLESTTGNGVGPRQNQERF